MLRIGEGVLLIGNGVLFLGMLEAIFRPFRKFLGSPHAFECSVLNAPALHQIPVPIVPKGQLRW